MYSMFLIMRKVMAGDQSQTTHELIVSEALCFNSVGLVKGIFKLIYSDEDSVTVVTNMTKGQ